MASQTETPQFTFNENTTEKAKSKPETGKKPPETDKTSPPEIGNTIKTEFKTDTEKSLVAGNFIEVLGKKFQEFSQEFQKNFCDTSGKPDFQKILGLFGLGETLGKFIQPQKVDQAEIISTPETINRAQKNSLHSTQPTNADQPSSFSFGNERVPSKSNKIPERPADALTGQEFIAKMNTLGNMNDKAKQAKMEEYFLAEVERGNIPSFCRPENMKTITMKGSDGTTVQYQAGLDYLAVGSDHDFIRIPITPILAQKIAKHYGLGLPTGPMTDAIHDQADIKLNGIGMVYNKKDQFDMQGNKFIEKHSNKINDQLGPAGLEKLRQGKALIAGHKKDVIISRFAIDHPGSLDFRGLYIDGKNPIQQNPAHEWTYRDYSHGFRPIGGNVIIVSPNGTTVTRHYSDALRDPAIARILNGAEGAIEAGKAYQPQTVKKKSAKTPIS